MATTVFVAESNSSCLAAPSGTNTSTAAPNTQVQGPVFYRCAHDHASAHGPDARNETSPAQMSAAVILLPFAL